MKSVKFRMIAIALLSATMPFTAKAQDKVEASVGADFVSNYIWRGTDCGGVSHPSPARESATRACH